MFASVLKLQKLCVYLHLNSDESDVPVIHPILKQRAKLPCGELSCSQLFLLNLNESGWHLRLMLMKTAHFSSLPLFLLFPTEPHPHFHPPHRHIFTHRNKFFPLGCRK